MSCSFKKVLQIFNFKNIVLVFVFGVFSLQSVQALEISEIMYDPAGADDYREYIEVHNENKDPINLENVVLYKKSKPLQIKAFQDLSNPLLLGNEYAIIVDDGNKFLSFYPDLIGKVKIYVSAFNSILNSSGGETLELQLNGQTLFSSGYSPTSKANGTGKSLNRVSGAWAVLNPTPGAAGEGQDNSPIIYPTPDTTSTSTTTDTSNENTNQNNNTQNTSSSSTNTTASTTTKTNSTSTTQSNTNTSTNISNSSSNTSSSNSSQNSVAGSQSTLVPANNYISNRAYTLGDLSLSVPREMETVAGQNTEFNVKILDGKKLPVKDNIFWSYGDGSEGRGATTSHRYLSQGVYTAFVEADMPNGYGVSEIKVKVYNPDISITKVNNEINGMGDSVKSSVTIKNNSNNNLNIGNFILSMDQGIFKLSRQLLLPAKSELILNGDTLGFKKASNVKLLFSDNTFLTQYTEPINNFKNSSFDMVQQIKNNTLPTTTINIVSATSSNSALSNSNLEAVLANYNVVNNSLKDSNTIKIDSVFNNDIKNQNVVKLENTLIKNSKDIKLVTITNKNTENGKTSTKRFISQVALDKDVQKSKDYKNNNPNPNPNIKPTTQQPSSSKSVKTVDTNIKKWFYWIYE